MPPVMKALKVLLGLPAMIVVFSTIQYVNNRGRAASPHKRVVFLKLHKTGSSTVQNIFIRFGDINNLTFVLASERHNDCDGNSNCISFKNTLNDRIILPPPLGKSFDILCSHVVYNRTSFSRYFSSDTRYISLLREPTTRLESAIAWHDDVDKGIKSNLSLFANNPTNFEHIMLNNRMAFELGFPKHLFPSRGHTNPNDEDREIIFRYLSQILNDFDLIMIIEKIDESLVLLKRLMQWNTKDILSSTKLVRKHKTFLPEDRTHIQSYLHLDYLLYKRAFKILNDKIAEAGPDFIEEVMNFRQVNANVNYFCKCKHCADGNLLFEGTRWSEPFSVDRSYCQKILLYEVQYLRKIRRRQY